MGDGEVADYLTVDPLTRCVTMCHGGAVWRAVVTTYTLYYPDGTYEVEKLPPVLLYRVSCSPRRKRAIQRQMASRKAGSA